MARNSREIYPRPLMSFCRMTAISRLSRWSRSANVMSACEPLTAKRSG